MKKILFIALALIGYASHKANAQETLELTYKGDSCWTGTSSLRMYYTLEASGLSPSTDYMVEFFWGDGSSSTEIITSGTMPPFYSMVFENHLYGSLGTYTQKFVLKDISGVALDSIIRTEIVACTNLYGINYIDNDADCIYSWGVDDLFLNPMPMVLKKSGIPVDTFESMGNYFGSIPSPEFGVVYTIEPLLSSVSGLGVSCPASGSYSFTLDTYSPTNMNFAYECGSSTNFDLAVVGYGLMRITDTSYFHIGASNLSCLPSDGTVTLTMSPKYTFQSANITPTSISGSVIVWDLTDLDALSPQHISIEMTPATTLTTADTASFVINITPSSGDVNVANNTFNFSDSILSSFDPNEKSAQPRGAMSSGQAITYTIQFENLGNDTAFNIHIIDTLANFLDVNTFQLENSTHAVSSNISNIEGKHVLRFDFANIELPSKDYPDANKGYVTFTMKSLPTMVPGDEIQNFADIYFDINEPVRTNTTLNYIPTPSGIFNPNHKDLSIYPNPAQNELMIKNPGNKEVAASIYDIIGKNVMSFNVDNEWQKIDISSLSNGVYFIKIVMDNEHYISKFVKK